jgi:hypothetical protein
VALDLSDEPEAPIAALDLPADQVPVEAVQIAIDAYRAGASDRAQLISVIDAHGVETEQLIATRALDALGGFRQALGAYEWIRSFPSAGRSVVIEDLDDLADLELELRDRAKRQPKAARRRPSQRSGPAFAAHAR